MVEMDIGYFGDERRRKVGELLVGRVSERQAVCLRKLGDDRAEHARFRRFLFNRSVTVAEMIAHRAAFAARAAVGRHVLAIQDTSELNYQAQSGRKHGLGTVGNGTDVGLFVHPVLAVDAETEQCLGLVSAQLWRRFQRKAVNYKSLPIERKDRIAGSKEEPRRKKCWHKPRWSRSWMTARVISSRNGRACLIVIHTF